MDSTTANTESQELTPAQPLPTVDVVVPCYNYGRYLRQCVESVLLQEGVRVRVLIIDDCSTDNTPEVGRALAADDDRVEYRRHNKNLGHIATYNEGLYAWVSSEFSLLLSADDMLAPGALKAATRLMHRDPSISLTYGRALEFTGPLPAQIDLVEPRATRIIEGSAFIEFAFRTAENPVPTPAAIVRTSCLRKIDGYDSTLPHSADLLFWLTLAAIGRVGIIDSNLAYYRRHDLNMTYDHRSPAFGDLKPRLAAFEKFASSEETRGKSEAWKELCRRSIAENAICHLHNCASQGRMLDAAHCIRFARQTYPGVRRARGWLRLALTAVATSAVSVITRRCGVGRRRPATLATVPKAIVIGDWPEVSASS